MCIFNFVTRNPPQTEKSTASLVQRFALSGGFTLGGSLLAVLQQAKHWQDQRPARPIPCSTRTLHKRRSWHTVAPGRWYSLSPGPLYGQTPVRSMIASSLTGHTNFSRAEVGGVMGGGKVFFPPPHHPAHLCT